VAALVGCVEGRRAFFEFDKQFKPPNAVEGGRASSVSYAAAGLAPSHAQEDPAADAQAGAFDEE